MKTFVRLILFLIFIFSWEFLYAQEQDTSEILIGIIENGDTIIHKELKEVTVYPDNRTKREQRVYSRLVARVKKVYPLAVEARELLKAYEPIYNSIEDKGEKRKLMKQLEKDLLADHKEELKKWSISDGRVLLKLIDRETEQTPYNIIKEYRGGLSALFWQGIARIFSNNLKDEYDPEGEDMMLEEIVVMVEQGYL